MIFIPTIIFAASGILLVAIISYGFARTQRSSTKPHIRPLRIMAAETIAISAKYIQSHGHLATIHIAQYISHGVHAGTQSFQRFLRSFIRSSFFPHKEVHNHESLLKALIEEKRAIEEKIEKLNHKNQ